MQTRRGFTLIELLVVVAVIALLIAILLPSLKRAKDQTRTTICLTNQRNLALAFAVYADEHQGVMPVAETDGPECWVDWPTRPNGTYLSVDALRDPTRPGVEAQKRGIRNGTLFPYVSEVFEVYHCPSDKRDTVDPYAGGRAYRSYSIPGCINAGKNPWLKEDCGIKDMYTKLSSVPEPAKSYIFIEESDPRGFNMNSWVMYLDQEQWIDPLAIHHKNGGTFAFADGHAELQIWQDDVTLQMSQYMEFWLSCPDSIDYQYMFEHWAMAPWRPEPGEP